MSLELKTLAHPLRIDAHGTVRIGDTRVTLETILTRFLMGESAEEIADAFALDLAHLYATISYYLQNRSDVDAYLHEVQAEEARMIAEARARNGPALREKLLTRLAHKNRAG